MPVCNAICEEGNIHKLECDVFSAVIDYYNEEVSRKRIEDKNKDESCDGEDNKLKDVEQLIKTFNISKLDSPCPTYTCITPLRILLKFRKDMTQQTMKLQNGEYTKDDVDVSNETCEKCKVQKLDVSNERKDVIEKWV